MSSSSSSSSKDVQRKRERRQVLDYEAVGKLMAGAQSKTSSKNSQTAIRCWRCGQDKHGGACKPQDYMNYEKQLLAIDQAFQRVCPPEGWNSTYEAEIEEEARTGDFSLKRLGNRKNCLRVELQTKVGEFHKHGGPSFARRWWTLRTTLREMHTYLELENSEIGNCKILSQHAQSIIFQNEAQDSSTFDTLLEEVFSFNTDGLDIGGDNNYVHDCDIRVGDDIVAIKGFNGQQSSNIRVENIIGSGFGLTIGSEGSAKNILFQNCSLNDTARAIYVKTRVENVVYKDITAGRSFLFPIWVGPPYQGIFNNGNCELTWPFAPPLISNLTTPPSFLCGGSVTVNNLTLVNVNTIESLTSPFISWGTIGNIHLENVNLPDNLLPSPFFEITNNGTFALDARPTCRFEPHGTTITATNSSHSFENCTRGGYLFEKAGVSNGVSYCPGRTYPQYSTSNEKFGVCQS